MPKVTELLSASQNSSRDSLTPEPRLLSTPLPYLSSVQFGGLFATPWTAVHQASLSITNSQSLLKLMSITSVMPSNHLILCLPLLLLPSIFSNKSVLHIRWPKYCRAWRKQGWVWGVRRLVGGDKLGPTPVRVV